MRMLRHQLQHFYIQVETRPNYLNSYSKQRGIFFHVFQESWYLVLHVFQ
jgi:hypothetical protein